jgi:SAM-dependent methyltransferase
MLDPTSVKNAPGSDPGPGLKLVLARCPLCRTDEAEPVAVGEDFAHQITRDSFLAVRCSECGLVYLSPQPAAEEHARVYPPSYFAPSHSARATGRRAVRRCGTLPAEARLLEVGYGASLHLEELRQAAPRAWVLEAVTPHQPAARNARKAGFVVYQTSAGGLEGRVGAYDAVLLLHALEHCADPLEELSSLSRLLREGGRLVILTENADSTACRVFQGRHWAGYDFPRHLSLFGPAALRRLAAEAGFEVERICTVGSPRVWTRSAAILAKDWEAPWWFTWSARLGAPILGALAFLGETMFALKGKGAGLEAVLRKREDHRR